MVDATIINAMPVRIPADAQERASLLHQIDYELREMSENHNAGPWERWDIFTGTELQPGVWELFFEESQNEDDNEWMTTRMITGTVCVRECTHVEDKVFQGREML